MFFISWSRGHPSHFALGSVCIHTRVGSHFPASRSGLPTSTERCAGCCASSRVHAVGGGDPFVGAEPCSWCGLSGHIWAWLCRGLSGTDQVHVASRLDPPCMFVFSGLLSPCNVYVAPRRTGPTQLPPLPGSIRPAFPQPAFSKCWLMTPLCTFVSEKGTWPLGGSWCSPESESHGSRGPNIPGNGDPRGWTPHYTVLQGPPAQVFPLFIWDPVLQGNFCCPTDGTEDSLGTEWPQILMRLVGLLRPEPGLSLLTFLLKLGNALRSGECGNAYGDSA